MCSIHVHSQLKMNLENAYTNFIKFNNSENVKLIEKLNSKYTINFINDDS